MKSIEEITEKLVHLVLEEKRLELNDKVTKNELKALRADLTDQGILVTKEIISPQELKPINRDLDEKKLSKLTKKFLKEKDLSLSPLVVSKEYYILDGHYRNKSVQNVSEKNNKRYKVPILRLDLKKENALKAFNDSIKKIKEQTSDLNHVVIYSGEFQPFHKGHFKEYEKLEERFGTNNVYIGTSDKTGRGAPFKFNEKRRLITKMYPVPHNKVIQVEDSYNPTEVLEGMNKDNTVFVCALSENNIETLSNSEAGKHFKKYNASDLKTFSDKSYYTPIKETAVNLKGKTVSEDNIKRIFSSDTVNEKSKKAFFNEIFGKYDSEMYDLVNNKFNREKLSVKVVEQFIVEGGMDRAVEKAEKMLKEFVDTSIAVPVDDGPAGWWKNQNLFEEENIRLANRMGLEVVKFLGDADDDGYKSDALPYASFFPTGVTAPEPNVRNPDRTWEAFAEAVSTAAGFELIEWLGADRAGKYEPIVNN